MKAAHKNVTFALPEELLKKFRVYSAERGVSMTQLVEHAIRKMIAEAPSAEERRRRLIERMENPPNLGTNGQITWTRDEIHER